MPLKKLQFHFVPPIIPKAFGLDISDSSIKIVQLYRQKDKFDIDLYAEKLIPKGVVQRGAIKDGEKLSEILIKIVKEHGDGVLSNYVVCSLPDEQVFLKTIKVPKGGEKELEHTALIETERNIPIDVRNAYLDFSVLKSKDKDKEAGVLLAAAQLPVADSYINSLQTAGLSPIILEPEVAAIARSVIAEEDKSISLVIVEMGANRTRLIGYGFGTILFTGSVDFSTDAVNKKIAEKLNIKEEEAKKIKWTPKSLEDKKYGPVFKDILDNDLSVLAEGIKKNILSWKNSGEVKSFSAKKLVLSGGGANIPGISEKLEKDVSLPVQTAHIFENLFRNKKNPPMDKRTALLFSTALGLAVRGTMLDTKEVYGDFK